MKKRFYTKKGGEKIPVDGITFPEGEDPFENGFFDSEFYGYEIRETEDYKKDVFVCIEAFTTNSNRFGNAKAPGKFTKSLEEMVAEKEDLKRRIGELEEWNEDNFGVYCFLEVSC